MAEISGSARKQFESISNNLQQSINFKPIVYCKLLELFFNFESSQILEFSVIFLWLNKYWKSAIQMHITPKRAKIYGAIYLNYPMA